MREREVNELERAGGKYGEVEGFMKSWRSGGQREERSVVKRRERIESG